MSRGKSSDFKIVSNGHVIEVYEYEKPVFYEFDGKGGRVADDMGYESERWEENRKLVSRRARHMIRNLALANFTEKDKFITLTFRDGSIPDVTDVKNCNNEYKKFIKRLRYWLKKQGRDDYDFKYLTVIEFQDENGRGAVHYHMMANFDYIPHEVLLKIWRHGSVRINRMDQQNDGRGVDNVGAYLTSYLIKDVTDPRLRGEKCYLCSRGLDRPVVYRGNEGYAKLILNSLGIDEKTKKVYTSSYSSEHHGLVTYKEYNLKRL